MNIYYICISTYINVYALNNQDQLIQYEELALGSRLKRLSEQLMKEAVLIYKKLHIDFDPYHMPIFKLVSEQNKLSISEISILLNVTQPAVTQYVNSLIKRGLIISIKDKVDQRKRNISLSTSGEIMLHKLKPIWKVIDQELKKLTHHTENKTLLDHIAYVESELNKKSFSQTVLDNLNR